MQAPHTKVGDKAAPKIKSLLPCSSAPPREHTSVMSDVASLDSPLIDPSDDASLSLDSPLFDPSDVASPLIDPSEKADSEVEQARAACVLWKRHVVAAMIFWGFINIYAMRTNLSVAVGTMQKKYSWSNEMEGRVLSSFFWGYLLGQIPGGLLASRWGGKQMFGLGVLSTGVMTMLLPFCASHLSALCALRAIMGLCEAVTLPAAYQMYGEWFPASERSFLVYFVGSGIGMGNAISYPISSYLVDVNDLKEHIYMRHFRCIDFAGLGLN